MPAEVNMDTTDILSGYQEIGDFLRVTKRQAKHLAEVGTLPTFNLGTRVVRARRSTLLAWIAEQEAACRQPKGPTP